MHTLMAVVDLMTLLTHEQGTKEPHQVKIGLKIPLSFDIMLSVHFLVHFTYTFCTDFQKLSNMSTNINTAICSLFRHDAD